MRTVTIIMMMVIKIIVNDDYKTMIMTMVIIYVNGLIFI